MKIVLIISGVMLVLGSIAHILAIVLEKKYKDKINKAALKNDSCYREFSKN